MNLSEVFISISSNCLSMADSHKVSRDRPLHNGQQFARANNNAKSHNDNATFPGLPKIQIQYPPCLKHIEVKWKTSYQGWGQTMN